jgi:restriction system protein
MAIPDYKTVMLPLLRLASDGKEHSIRSAMEQLADEFKLSQEERQELLPSGKQAVFHNRVGWARTYMKMAGLLESEKRGYFKITSRGQEVLKKNPTEINIDLLWQFEEFREFKTRARESQKKREADVPEGEEDMTPEESLEYGYERLQQELADELIGRIKRCSPAFFERLVVELLVKMGYGGSIRDAGQAIGKSADEGIDGVIKEDRLGLDIIYIQAKRWEGTVSRPEIQKFAGAVQGRRAKKGIFITTSGFSREAQEYISKIDNKISLIDGHELVQLMIECPASTAPEGPVASS